MEITARCATLVLLFGCFAGERVGGNGAAGTEPDRSAWDAIGARPAAISYSATVVTGREIELRSDSRARAAGLHVRVGSSVEKDAVVAVLESIDLDVALEEALQARALARLALQQGDLEVNRLKSSLSRRNKHPELYPMEEIQSVEFSLEKEELAVKQARLRVIQAESRVSEARDAHAALVVRAPLAGTVKNVALTQGQAVLSGDLVATLFVPELPEVVVVVSRLDVPRFFASKSLLLQLPERCHRLLLDTANTAPAGEDQVEVHLRFQAAAAIDPVLDHRATGLVLSDGNAQGCS